MIPGKSVSPARSLRMRLSRISDLTERRAMRPASTSRRSAPSVVTLGCMGSILAEVPKVLKVRAGAKGAGAEESKRTGLNWRHTGTGDDGVCAQEKTLTLLRLRQ